MKTNCLFLSDTELSDVRKEMDSISRIVQTAAGTLAARIHTNAPRKTGDLIEGIIPSPWEENSAYPGKIVRQVYMDSGMNDTFVKVTKNGKRYYYPASQEYGFRIANRSTLTPQQAATYKTSAARTKVPGKYFMHDTFMEYAPVFMEDVAKYVYKVVSK